LRKNHFSFQRVKGAYYTEFKIIGLNQDRLVNAFVKSGIGVYNVKKLTNKKMRLSVLAKDDKKAFAIAKELCYNIKKTNNRGKIYPMLSFFLRYGVLAGIAFFVLVSSILSDYVFSIDYDGSGVKHKSSVEEYLCSLSISSGARFSSINLSELEDKILASNDNLSFVSVKKLGNRLKITLIEAEEKKNVLSGSESFMISDVSGELESIKVYSGTAKVDVGQKINKGDVIVEGVAVIGENLVNVNVIATATIKVEKSFTFYSENEKEESLAISLARGEVYGENVVEEKVDSFFDGEKYRYDVTLTVRHVIFIG